MKDNIDITSRRSHVSAYMTFLKLLLHTCMTVINFFRFLYLIKKRHCNDLKLGSKMLFLK